jgi:hypothetical protein
MAERRRRRSIRPSRPLSGYRDVGAPGPRYSPPAVYRAWAILVVLIVIYLAIMLTIYFIEPGLR